MDNGSDDDTSSEFLVKRVRIPRRLVELLDRVSEVVDATPKWCLNMLMMKVDHIAHTQPELLGFEYERASESRAQINVNVLHRSERTKSGYVGVYVNGKGFTAMGKFNARSTEQKSLGTFPTAAQAAEARRQHYLKNGIPYGALAERIETFNGSDVWRGASDELKRRQAIYELAKEGTPVEGLSDEDKIWETRDPLG